MSRPNNNLRKYCPQNTFYFIAFRLSLTDEITVYFEALTEVITSTKLFIVPHKTILDAVSSPWGEYP